MAKRTADEVCEIYRKIAEMVASGQLAAPVEHVYPIDEIRAALVHAQRTRRNGEILVAPNGLI